MPKHEDYLVDSLIDSNVMMKDWECTTDVLMEDPRARQRVFGCLARKKFDRTDDILHNTSRNWGVTRWAQTCKKGNWHIILYTRIMQTQ
jgi:hypothetical protein